MESDSDTVNDVKQVSTKVVYDLTCEDEKKPYKVSEDEKKERIEKKIKKEMKKMEQKRRIGKRYNSEEEIKKCVEDLGLQYDVFRKYYEIRAITVPDSSGMYMGTEKTMYRIKLKMMERMTDYEKAERKVYNKELFGMGVNGMIRVINSFIGNSR